MERRRRPLLGPDTLSLARLVGFVVLPWAVIIWLPFALRNAGAEPLLDPVLYALIVAGYPVVAGAIICHWNRSLHRAAESRISNSAGEEVWIFADALISEPDYGAADAPDETHVGSGWLAARGDRVEVWGRHSAEPILAVDSTHIARAVALDDWTGLSQECTLCLALDDGRSVEMAIQRYGIGDLLGVSRAYIRQICLRLTRGRESPDASPA
jgi:hypothetical protein